MLHGFKRTRVLPSMLADLPARLANLLLGMYAPQADNHTSKRALTSL